MPVRFDAGELSKPVKQPNGWLRADGFITRTGVFTYRRADGSTIREYRPPEEVFHPDSLESFAMVPMTNDHPPDGLLDASNTRQYQVGTVVAPRADGSRVRSQFLVTDAETVKDMKDGKVQLSCGYVCDLDETPGTTPEGERFDARQIHIRGNHVALVAVGRAGPEIKLRMDAAAVVLDGTEFALKQDQSHSDSAKVRNPKMFKLDGVDYEMSDTAAQAVQKALEARNAEIKTLKTGVETATAKADSASAEVGKLKEELKAAPGKYAAQAKARAELEGKARSILGEEKIDGLSDRDLKCKVISSEMPKLKLDAKSDDYVDAMFDTVCEKHDAEEAKADEPETSPISERKDSTDPLAAAKRAYQEALDKVQPR